MDCEFASLVSPEFIGSSKGSTLSELTSAANSIGLEALATGNLTISSLKYVTTPTILYVRSSIRDRDYNHFILLIGWNDELAVVYDPPHKIEYIDPYDIAIRWNGIALILSDEPISLSSIRIRAVRSQLGFALAVVALLVLFRKIAFSFAPKVGLAFHLGTASRICLQAISILFMAMACSWVHQSFRGYGFLNHLSALRLIEQEYADRFLSRINYAEVQARIREGSVIVDARLPRDFGIEHIPGAININPTIEEPKMVELLAGYDVRTRFVVYCQSVQCDFDEHIARLMVKHGYKDIEIYDGGWNDWHERTIDTE